MNSLNINFKISKKIYENLIIGKYINKDEYNEKDNTLIRNELYFELKKHFITYQEIYKSLGFFLEEKEEYYYLTAKNFKLDDENDKPSENEQKIYILMVLILRFILDNGRNLEELNNHKLGIELSFFNKIKENQKYHNLIKLGNFSGDNYSKIISNYLIKNNLCFINNKSNLCFTNSGKSFINYCKSIGKEILDNSN